MGILTEPKLDELVGGSCPGCGGGRFKFRAYLDARLPILGGEPVGKLTWTYDGEKFVDGVFEVSCADCKRNLLQEAMCPRCHRDDGLAQALGQENQFPLLKECPKCQAEELRYYAMLPATVIYERKRALPPRADIDPYDPGFHGYRVDCPECRKIAEQSERCPLCDAKGPLRPRP